MPLHNFACHIYYPLMYFHRTSLFSSPELFQFEEAATAIIHIRIHIHSLHYRKAVRPSSVRDIPKEFQLHHQLAARFCQPFDLETSTCCLDSIETSFNPIYLITNRLLSCTHLSLSILPFHKIESFNTRFSKLRPAWLPPPVKLPKRKRIDLCKSKSIPCEYPLRQNANILL
jgi:hypothetical protein